MLKTANYRFSHIGVPIATENVQPNETYYEELKLYCTDPDMTEYHIEYLRPAPGCTFFPILLDRPHVSMSVDNLEEAMKDEKVVVEPFDPFPGRTICFIDVNGLIIELSYDHPC